MQIPAFNEERDIACVIQDIPKRLAGIASLEIVVIDDGSSDSTSETAGRAGVRKIVRFGRNRGLGAAFKTGLCRALEMGADIIVNMDADGQYRGDDMQAIVDPVLRNEAGMVIGARKLRKVRGYPSLKLAAQSAASGMVSRFLGSHGTDIKDVTSGFRAFSRETARILIRALENQYTYTLESVCVLARKGIPILSVPVDINYPSRKSRLIKSKWHYGANFLITLLKHWGAHSIKDPEGPIPGYPAAAPPCPGAPLLKKERAN